MDSLLTEMPTALLSPDATGLFLCSISSCPPFSVDENNPESAMSIDEIFTRFEAVLSDEERRRCELASAWALELADPKLINPVFKLLGDRFPMNALGHLKRVKKSADNKSLIIVDVKDNVSEESLLELKVKWPSARVVEVEVPRHEALTEPQRVEWATYWPIASRVVELYTFPFFIMALRHVC